MKSPLHIPISVPEARAKLRGGLGECASFVIVGPWLIFCWLLRHACLAFVRLVAERRRVAGFVFMRVCDCFICSFLTTLFELWFGL